MGAMTVKTGNSFGRVRKTGMFSALFCALFLVFSAGAAHAQVSNLLNVAEQLTLGELQDAALTGNFNPAAITNNLENIGAQQVTNFMASQGIPVGQINDPGVQQLLRANGFDPMFVTDPATAATNTVQAYLQSEMTTLSGIGVPIDLSDPMGTLQNIGQVGLNDITNAALNNVVPQLNQLVGGLDLNGLVNLDSMISSNIPNLDQLTAGLNLGGLTNLQDILNIDAGNIQNLIGGLDLNGIADLTGVFNNVADIDSLINGLDLQGIQDFTDMLSLQIPNLDTLLGGLTLQGIDNLTSVLNLGLPDFGNVLDGLVLSGITDLQNALNGAIPDLTQIGSILGIPDITNLTGIVDTLGLNNLTNMIPDLGDLLSGLNLGGLDNLQNLLSANIPDIDQLLGGLNLNGIDNLQNFLNQGISGITNLVQGLDIGGILNMTDLFNNIGVGDLNSLIGGLDIMGFSNLTTFLNSGIANVTGIVNDLIGSVTNLGMGALQDVFNSVTDLGNLLGGLNLQGIGNFTDILNMNLPIDNLLGGLDLIGMGQLGNLLNGNIPLISSLNIPFLDPILDAALIAQINNFMSMFGGMNILQGLLSNFNLTGLLGLQSLFNLGIGNLGSILMGAFGNITQLLDVISLFNLGGGITALISGLASILGINLGFGVLSGGGGCCGCMATYCQQCPVEIEHNKFRNVHAPTEFEEHRILLMEDTWVGHFLPAMMFMTEQLSITAMQQVEIIGAMLDAKTQLETQFVIQKLHAKAHKDYHPSNGICEFGTNVRSLWASQRRSDFMAQVLSQRSMDRQLGVEGTNSSEGKKEDLEGRFEQFVSLYCDPRDFNTGLTDICEAGGRDNERWNKDIDYTRLVDDPNTLEIDFMENAGGPNPGGATNDETDVFALASNLYSHSIFTRIPENMLVDSQFPDLLSTMQQHYLATRAIAAKRSVAENSFNAVVAMKAEGSSKDNADGGSRDYMIELMKELAIPDAEILEILGENPSYYAQMDVLTRKIYQNPDFYVNLYDTPANVARKRVALRAIGLMQDRDIFLSQLRTEAMVSVLLELSLEEIQEDVEGELTKLGAATR